MNNIGRKRERDEKPITITLGKLQKGYYYIGDSLNESCKIKISIAGLPKEESKKYSKEKLSKSSTQNNNNYIENEDEGIIISESQSNYSSQMIPHDLPLIQKITHSQPISLPSCSSWFNIDDINEIEVNALPEFFAGKYPSKSPSVYKEYRNFIINLYRQNPNTYLSATTCRRHLSGDVCSIIRIHSFLEHWGLINFKVDPIMKPTNPFLPKAFNFKSPIYIDASTFLVKEGNHPVNKIGTNNVVLTNKFGEEIRSLYPINTHPESLYRSFFNQNPSTALNQINFLTKNYRPKCDLCSHLCDLDWYITINNGGYNPFDFDKETNIASQLANCTPNETNNTMLLICEECHSKGEFPSGLTQEDFELSNVFNILLPNDKCTARLKERMANEKWTEEETNELIRAIDIYGETNWDEVVKVFNGKRTKADCIIHFIQLPIKESISFKVADLKQKPTEVGKIAKSELNAITDQNNPLIGQVVFFAKMFEKCIEEEKHKAIEESNKNSNDRDNQNELNANMLIGNSNDNSTKDTSSIDFLKNKVYKAYSTSVNQSVPVENKEVKDKKIIMNLLTYLQLKKLELKLNCVSDFEKIIHYESTQLKTMDNQIMQDRIKLSIKRNELICLGLRLQEAKKLSHEELMELNNIKFDSAPKHISLNQS